MIIQDSSAITLPATLAGVWRGCGGSNAESGAAALKIQISFDLLGGALQGPLLQDGRAHDQNSPLREAPVCKDALYSNDLGYFDLDAFNEIQAGGGFFLSRLKVQTALYSAEDQGFDLVSFLKGQVGNEVVVPIRIGAKHRIACRLLAIRVEEAVANERRRKLNERARRKGQPVSKARLDLADWTILVTNTPSELLSLEEALVLARARWQVELIFKLWKQRGLIDEWRTKNPYRILCELYAKLIAMVVQHWLFLISCWANPDRSLVKAAETVQGAAFALGMAMTGASDIHVVIAEIANCLGVGCRMNGRKKKPNTYQLLMEFSNAA